MSLNVGESIGARMWWIQLDKKKAKAKLKAIADTLICDALLEQDIFARVGNIIKNEILYRVHLAPESIIGKISTAKINKFTDEVRIYSLHLIYLGTFYFLLERETCESCNIFHKRCKAFRFYSYHLCKIFFRSKTLKNGFKKSIIKNVKLCSIT